jgi:DNA-binding transcriptional MocR family regulator
LRIGWVRAPESVRSMLLRYKAASDLGSSVPSQVLTTQLLSAVDEDWLRDLRAALLVRRNHLQSLLAAQLPAWRPTTPRAGLSLWVELPVANADVFAHVASRHGVTVAPGSTMCHDGHHHHGIRLSFAEPLTTLELAVERLASAWEVHTADLASTPSRI